MCNYFHLIIQIFQHSSTTLKWFNNLLINFFSIPNRRKYFISFFTFWGFKERTWFWRWSPAGVSTHYCIFGIIYFSHIESDLTHLRLVTFNHFFNYYNNFLTHFHLFQQEDIGWWPSLRQSSRVFLELILSKCRSIYMQITVLNYHTYYKIIF